MAEFGSSGGKKNTVMKTFLSVLFMLLPTIASAETIGLCGNNVTYIYDESTHVITISGTGDMTDYDTWNPTPWASYLDNIQGVVIETGVTSIGDFAFGNCSNLTSVSIPNSVRSIGVRAFEWCTNLASIVIPNSVTHAGEQAFNGTAWSLNQPVGVVYVGKVAYGYSLGNDDKLPDNIEINIKDGTTEIASEAFFGNHILTSVTIPNSVTAIGKHAFYDCLNLRS